jgi:hypothetical protein
MRPTERDGKKDCPDHGFFCGMLFVTAASAEKFVLKSPDIKQGQKVGVEQVFSGMGCTGKTFYRP